MAGTVVITNHGGGSALFGAFSSGTIVADGAATTVRCGFVPMGVKLINITTDAVTYWYSPMADGSKQTEGGAYSATLGFTSAAGGNDLSAGFTIDASLMAASDNLIWVAFR